MASFLTAADRATMAQDVVSLRDTYPTSVTFRTLTALVDQPDYHPQMGWKDNATKRSTSFSVSCIVVPMAQAKMRGMFATKKRLDTAAGEVPIGDLLIEVVAADLGVNTITDTSFCIVDSITYRVSAVETVGTLLYVYAEKTPATESLADPLP